MNHSTEKPKSFLAPQLTPPAVKRCLDALLDVREPLPYAPIEHSSRWYDLASRPERVRWQFTEVEMMRSALVAAHAEGPKVFAEVYASVELCFAQMQAEVMRGFDRPAFACPMEGAAVVVKELNEATTAAVEFASSPSPSTQQRAASEIAEAGAVVNRFGRFLAQHAMDHRQPMSA